MQQYWTQCWTHWSSERNIPHVHGKFFSRFPHSTLDGLNHHHCIAMRLKTCNLYFAITNQHKVDERLKPCSIVVLFYLQFLQTDKLNATVLHCAAYLWRLQWNERLMKDFYLLSLLTFPDDLGDEPVVMRQTWVEMKMLNLAVRCADCGCFWFFLTKSFSMMRLEVIKYLLIMVRLLALPFFSCSNQK